MNFPYALIHFGFLFRCPPKFESLDRRVCYYVISSKVLSFFFFKLNDNQKKNDKSSIKKFD